MQSEPKRPNPLPHPTALLVLQEEYIRAFLRLLPPKKRLTYLREVSEGMRRLEENVDVVRFGPLSEAARLKASRLEAIALWRQLLPVFIRDLDE